MTESKGQRVPRDSSQQHAVEQALRHAVDNLVSGLVSVAKNTPRGDANALECLENAEAFLRTTRKNLVGDGR